MGRLPWQSGGELPPRSSQRNQATGGSGCRVGEGGATHLPALCLLGTAHTQCAGPWGLLEIDSVSWCLSLCLVATLLVGKEAGRVEELVNCG